MRVLGLINLISLHNLCELVKRCDFIATLQNNLSAIVNGKFEGRVNVKLWTLSNQLTNITRKKC